MRVLEDVDVLVLAGGLGTRIREVLGDVPKVLAPINGRPFLDYVLDWLTSFGAQRVVLCLGHLAGRVTAHMDKRHKDGVEIVPVIEPEPLGTAGALRLARAQLGSDPVLVMNGDTFLYADLDGFLRRHRAVGVGLSLLCAEVPSIARFGSIEVDSNGRIARFVEKDLAQERPGLVSAGMYLVSQAMLDELMRRQGPSLERDFLQSLPAGTIRAELSRCQFIDIGTPESLAEAGAILIPSDPTRPKRTSVRKRSF